MNTETDPRALEAILKSRRIDRSAKLIEIAKGRQPWWMWIVPSLVILVFVILGNSASGGPFARPLLPGLWRTIGGVLPPGASVDLSRSALFFGGARIAGPVLVLVGWAALGTLLALALGGRIMDPVDAEAAAAAGAAV